MKWELAQRSLGVSEEALTLVVEKEGRMEGGMEGWKEGKKEKLARRAAAVSVVFWGSLLVHCSGGEGCGVLE